MTEDFQISCKKVFKMFFFRRFRSLFGEFEATLKTIYLFGCLRGT